MKMKTRTRTVVCMTNYNPSCEGVIKAILERLPESERKKYSTEVQDAFWLLWTIGNIGMQEYPHCLEILERKANWGGDEKVSQVRKVIANRFEMKPKALTNRMFESVMTIATALSVMPKTSTKA